MSAVDLVPISADAAAPAGLSPPQVGAPRAGGNGKGRGRGQGTADSADCAGLAAGDQPSTTGEAFAKPWKSAQASCLLAGFTANLIDGDDGRPLLVVSRWAMTRAFDNLAEVEAWLVRVGAKA